MAASYSLECLRKASEDQKGAPCLNIGSLGS